MKIIPIVLIAGIVLCGLVVGCSSTPGVDKEAKRSQDRMAMQLSEAETQRNQLKTDLEKAQTELSAVRKSTSDTSQEVVLLRKQVTDLQNANQSLSTKNEKLQNDLTRATATVTKVGSTAK